MDVDYLFETPLIVAQFTDTAPLNAALLRAIEERFNADPQGVAISNRLGWHSDRQMLDWGGDPAGRLARAVVELANTHCGDIGGKGRRRFVWVPEMWANISGKGASNQLHTHPGSFWSAVYYVDDGYLGSTDQRLGGELELEDPRLPMVNMEAPDLRFRPSYKAPPAVHEIAIRPSTGRLLMFPSWLRHGVKPYFGTGRRVSIAINLTAVRLPAKMLEEHPEIPGPPSVMDEGGRARG